MSAPDYSYVVGDRLPEVPRTLARPDGSTPDLTGCTVQFKVWAATGGDAVYRAATLVDGPTARVNYAPGAGDLATPGLFFARFVVTFPDSRVESFADDGGRPIAIQVDRL